MSAANWIALAAIAATVTVSIAGILVNMKMQSGERKHRAREADADRTHREREADAQREHALAMARAARYFEARLRAYGEAGRMLERIRLNVQRIEPQLVVGEPVPPPGGFDDAEWEAMVATITIASSTEVLAAIETAHEKFSFFRAHAGTFVALRDQQAAAFMVNESRDAMERSRTDAWAAIDAAEQMMRDELRAL